MRRLDEQPVEFHVVECEEDLEQDELDLFLLRFERSAKSSGFSAQAAARLHAALHAMTENAVIHAGAPIGALVGYRIVEERPSSA